MVTLSNLRQQVETQQGTSGLDSAQVSAIAGSGVSVFETLDSLPSTGLTAGDEAFVKVIVDFMFQTVMVGIIQHWLIEHRVGTLVENLMHLIQLLILQHLLLLLQGQIDSDNGNLVNQSTVSAIPHNIWLIYLPIHLCLLLLLNLQTVLVLKLVQVI